MTMWNPWRGCKKCSEGCLHCYIHKGDAKRGVDTGNIVKTKDWGVGYENVVVCCTIENQKNADKKLAIFQSLPIKHKCITAQPLIEKIDIEQYLGDIELVVVGGESDYYARLLDYEWVLDIREQCVREKMSFEFRQCGTYCVKDGKQYKL